MYLMLCLLPRYLPTVPAALHHVQVLLGPLPGHAIRTASAAAGADWAAANSARALQQHVGT
jgi:hypothetical protein